MKVKTGNVKLAAAAGSAVVANSPIFTLRPLATAARLVYHYLID
jgi:hypothetical protein